MSSGTLARAPNDNAPPGAPMTEFAIKEEQHANLIKGLSKHERELRLCSICGGTMTAAKRENPARTSWSVIDPDSEYRG